MISTPRGIGNYVLEHELGRGATSQVWRGRHRFLHERAVAVKILLSQDEESVARFSREADLASRLRHPNVVAVYDHGTAGSFLYTIMELVPGGSLRQHMEKHGRVSLKDAVSISGRSARRSISPTVSRSSIATFRRGTSCSKPGRLAARS